MTSNLIQTTLNPVKNDFSYQVCEAFLKADIPLWKLRSQSIGVLFKLLGHDIPSETSCRRKIDEIKNNQIISIKKKVSNSRVFLIVDEGDVDKKKFINILLGTIREPTKIYLGNCVIVHKSPDSNLITSIIDDFLKDFEIRKVDFCLLSDAAPYMKSTAKKLKIFYPNLFHLTCITHLLHNCAMRVQSYFSDVNMLIASIKIAIQKHYLRRQLFSDNIGIPPDVIVTRWGTWLKAAFYYAEHLPEVRNLVNSFEDDGKIVLNAKISVSQESLALSLVKISTQYQCLLTAIESCESRSFSIIEAENVLKTLNFLYDNCNIAEYLKLRLSDFEFFDILNQRSETISP